MHSLLRYSLAATAVLSMAQGAATHPTANKQEKPDKVEGQPGAQFANAKALYFITNDDDNALAAIELGADGLITGNGAVYQTGGKGANGIDGATNSSAAPDSLFSQSSLTVAGKHIFVVNAGSNSLSMFAIDEANPSSLEQVGEPILLPGDFPNTVAASEKNGLVCVGLTGQKAGISCAAFSAEGGLGEADDLRELQLGQSTPPVGPTNTVSQVFWSDDESHLLATVKGNPEKGNNGFFSAYAVEQGDPGAEANFAGAGGLGGKDEAEKQANFAGANGLNGKNQTGKQDQLEAEKQSNQYNQAYNQANGLKNASDPAAAALAAQEGQNKADNKDNQANNQNNLLANATGAVFGAEEGEKNQADASKQQNQDQNNLFANTTGAVFGAAEASKNQTEVPKQQNQNQNQNQLLDQQAGSAFAISAQNFYLSRDEVRSSPEGTAVLFGSVAIPGTQDVLATDASFGVAVLSLLDAVLGGNGANNDNKKNNDDKDNNDKKKNNDDKDNDDDKKNNDDDKKNNDDDKKNNDDDKKNKNNDDKNNDKAIEQLLQKQDKKQKSYQTKGRLSLPGQKATCWAAISPLTNSAFVTDVGRNKLIEIGGYSGEGKGLDMSIIGEIDLSAVGGADMGVIDLRAAGQFVYALSPGDGRSGNEPVINVVDVRSKEFVQSAKLAGVGAGRNSMGMAVYI